MPCCAGCWQGAGQTTSARCGPDGSRRVQLSRAVATVEDENGDKRLFEIYVEIKRANLVLEEGEPRLVGVFCGHNGTIDGSYRRVRKLNLSSES